MQDWRLVAVLAAQRLRRSLSLFSTCRRRRFLLLRWTHRFREFNRRCTLFYPQFDHVIRIIRVRKKRRTLKYVASQKCPEKL